MGSNVVYGAGVVTGTAYCNNLVSPIQTTATAFTITLGGMTREEETTYKAQTTYALKANSLKLPQLTTAQQTTLPPQQAGNLIYNADHRQMAVHDGSNWQYVQTTVADPRPIQK